MKRMFSALFAAALLAVVPAAAHHSISAEFDLSKPVKFSGVITKVDWTNPHIYTHVEVKEGGKATIYRVEGGPPNSLFRQGWRKDTLNIGQATIITADGRRVFGGAANRDGNAPGANAPAAN